MTNYAKGRAFEYEVKHSLEAMGFTVIRSAASKSPIDLVGFSKEKGVWLVQCKRKKPSKQEEAQFKRVEAGNDVRKWLVYRLKGSRTTIWRDVNENHSYDGIGLFLAEKHKEAVE